MKLSYINTVLLILLLSACSKADDPYLAYAEGDYETARQQLLPLVEKDDPQAQTYLAAIYQMDRDYQQAIRLYTAAARQDYAPAQYNLGVMLHEGIGVDQNLNEAYAWLFTAAQQGHSKAKEQLKNMSNEITPNMTMQAREWVKAQLKSH